MTIAAAAVVVVAVVFVVVLLVLVPVLEIDSLSPLFTILVFARENDSRGLSLTC